VGHFVRVLQAHSSRPGKEEVILADGPAIIVRLYLRTPLTFDNARIDATEVSPLSSLDSACRVDPFCLCHALNLGRSKSAKSSA